MDSANGFKCAICYDSICCDSTKYQSINLTCGHAFGKSCMRKWVESSNQKKCLLCRNPLTDIEINEIKTIPLQERAVIISKKAFKLFGQTISQIVSPFANPTAREFATVCTVATVATVAIAAVAWAVDWITDVSSIVGITGCAGIIAWTAGGIVAELIPGDIVGAAVGAVGVAAGFDSATAQAVGAAAGALGTAGALVGYFEVTASAVAAATGVVDVAATAEVLWFAATAGAIGITAATIGITAGAIGVTAGAVGAVITAGAFGAAVIPAGAFGAPAAAVDACGFILGALGGVLFISGAVAGAAGADAAYREQEMNPVIV